MRDVGLDPELSEVLIKTAKKTLAVLKKSSVLNSGGGEFTSFNGSSMESVPKREAMTKN